MVGAAAFVFCIQYFSEKSMSDIIDVASENSNDEYDWFLPFVTAAGEESEFVYVPNADGVVFDPKDPQRVLFSTKADDKGQFKWQDKGYESKWTKEMKMGRVDEFYDG
jgi:hypothetical protein